MGFNALAKVLCIDEPENEHDMEDAILHGLPSDGFDVLARKLGISPRELSERLHVSMKTIQRHKGRALDVNLSDRLYRVAQVYTRCLEVFESEEATVVWLQSNIPALNGATPLDCLGTTPGVNRVMTLIGRIEHGVYS